MAGQDDPTDLIRQAQGGDRSAFEALLRGHYDMMYRIAYRWCGDKADAEDITQNACIKLARSIDGFRFRSAFSTWLYRLVINTAKDWAKGRARPAAQAEPEIEPAVAPAGEGRVYAGQVMAHIRTLPEKEQAALFLVFGEGMSHGEAALVLECKESTVSWYIHEARKKLQPLRMMESRDG